MAGLYDCDGKTDLALYEPSTAKFKLLRSEQSWNTLVTHQFDPEFIPYPSGAGEERSGVIALGGFTAPRLCGGPILHHEVPRRSAALFYPGAGTWNLIWNPTIVSSAVQSCQYGSGAGDQPIAGLDRDLDKANRHGALPRQLLRRPGEDLHTSVGERRL